MRLDFGSIQWLGVITAAVAAFALGALWYSPLLFAARWMRAIGKRPEELGNPIRAMSLNLVATFLTAIVMALFVDAAGVQSWLGGLGLGLLIGVGVVGLVMFSDYLFCGWSNELFAIQVGYRVAYLALMGAILGAWQ